MALLSAFGKQGVKLGLLTKKIDIEDMEYLSKYFVISEFNPIFSGGKNAVSFNGSDFLKNGSEIQVECLDSQGNSLYLEQAKSSEGQYSDIAKFVVSIHVYDETYNGNGKLIIVGTTKKNETVRWIGNITIDKTLDNNSKIRFYEKPSMEVRSLLYPVVDTSLAEVQFPPPETARAATGTAVMDRYVGSITVTNGGSGYTSVPTVTFSGGTATAQLAGGKVHSITVTDGGTGYSSAPSITISPPDDPSGTQAYATATLLRRVQSITLSSGGAGYAAAPAITFGTNAGGSGAAASATVAGGVVTGTTITNQGGGYTGTPSVTFDSPSETPPPDLIVPVTFEASFYTLAANPKKDTIKSSINAKQTDVDYRIILTGIPEEHLTSSLFPTGSFNSQMEGKTLTLYTSKIQVPYSKNEAAVNLTSSFTIKKVINSYTAVLSDPFYYPSGKNNVVTHILEGKCTGSYRFVNYNTNPDSYKTLDLEDGDTVTIKDSYAEITYRNLRPFSGFIARHKLYRKSSFYTGDFQLISDEPLGAIELMSDVVTFNKFYDRIGVIYNQAHAQKYWFTSSADVTLEALAVPINSMKISMADPNSFTGNEYVIVKTDSIEGGNDNVYYPYDAVEYNQLSGSSYNSNFISLKKDALYVLSTNVIMEKDVDVTDAKISFYFTSSIAAIQKEKSYEPTYGLKLGEITTADKVKVKYFNDKQYIYFTPTADYYGTVVAVPYKCNVTISDFSLKVYGDHGFSPDILFIQVPFPVNVANEAFELRAELFDINSNLVYSNLRATETFDEDGASLFKSAADTQYSLTVIKQENIVVNGDAYLPDLTTCPDAPKRFVGWQIPVGEIDGTEGKLCYTNVSNLYISGSDYISLSSYEDGIEVTATAIAVLYDLEDGTGRKVIVDEAGVRTEVNPWF